MYFKSEIGAAWFNDSFDIKDKKNSKWAVFLLFSNILKAWEVHAYTYIWVLINQN